MARLVEHLTLPQLLGLLVAMLAAARLCGAAARAVGQPAVLGELVAGVLLGTSALGLVDPGVEAVHILAELGVVLLRFAIGLETDPRELLRVRTAAAGGPAARAGRPIPPP